MHTPIHLTSKRNTTLVPPSLEGSGISFEVRVPTPVDKDEIQLLIYRMGLREVTVANIRALIVSELWSIYPEDRAEEAATLLETIWQLQQLDTEEVNQWAEQERERRLDIEQGIKDPALIPEEQPLPQRRVKPRDNSRIDQIVQDVCDRSQAVRDKLAEQNAYQIKMRRAVVQLHMVGATGLDTVVEQNAGMLSIDTLNAVREELADKDYPAAYDELYDQIDALYSLKRQEVGNSDSPLTNTANVGGSINSSGGSASSGGSSTKTAKAKSKSSTTRARAGGSAKTTGTSSQPLPA